MADRSRALFGSVRLRLTIAATLVVGVTFAIASVALVSTVRNSLERQARSDGIDAMQAISHQLESGARPQQLSFDAAPVLIQVIGSDGQVLAASAGIGGRRLVDNTDRVDVSIARNLRTGDEYVVYQQVRAPSGSFVVAVSSPLDSVRQSVDTLARNLWIATPLLLAVVAIVAWLLAGLALRPVAAIRTEVDEITHSTMYRRVPVPPGDDEVAHLATTMNEMLDRLERASVRQREFVSDASHELRSPLAASRAQLEVALRKPERADWETVARRVLAEHERLGTLVDDLLELARLDEGAAVRPHTDVDLDELVLTDLASRGDVAHFSTQNVSAGRVPGDGRQLTQVVRNLLDNAVRHAQGTVSVTVRDDGEMVLLAVEDDGPGLEPADRARVFERFTRLDQARARDAGGAGLGLALVHRIVDAHQGTIAFVDPVDGLGGARVEARFPAELRTSATRASRRHRWGARSDR